MHTAVLLLLVCLQSLAILIGAQQQQASVDRFVTTTITNGTLRGSVRAGGDAVETYFGIPYASPPLRNLRFRPPEPAVAWRGTRNALEPSRICPQISDEDNIDNSQRSEDCLYLNVFTPTLREGALPVLVWIHGGGFRTGQGAQYDGRRLASKGVIVVTFNYRLDVLGFLSTEDDVMPGNYGMLDMVAALRWVNENIAAFGGDRDRVTIAGQSSGGVSVSMLLLSPLARGLFRGAIMESGVSIMPGAWAQPTRSVSHSLTTKLIGREVGCDSEDSAELMRCFQAADIDLLLRVSRELRLLVAGWSAPILLSPRVEQTYGFLPDMPSRLLYRGEFHRVNTIRGFNEHEVAYFMDFAERIRGSSAENFNETVRLMLKPFSIIDKDHIFRRTAAHYLEDITPSPLAYAQAEIAFATDFLFEAATINEIRMASRANVGASHYLYRYSVRPQTSTKPGWVSAVHADELASLFAPASALEAFDSSHRESMEAVATMWANFIKTGNPNGPQRVADSNFRWMPFSRYSQPIAHITESGVEMARYTKGWVTGAFSRFLKRTDTIYPY